MLRRQGNHIITSRIEHPAVLECFKKLAAQGTEVSYLDPDSDGRVSCRQLEELLRPDTVLVSVMHVNNETGTIQPVDEMGPLIKKKCPKALFHCDGVQSFGKLPVKPKEWSMDLFSASGHKIHGPKGTGLLYVKKGIHLPVYIYGGGQEQGFRSGTENVPGISGLGAAAAEAEAGMKENFSRVKALRERLLAGIRAEIPDIKVNSPEENCLPYILNVSFLGTRGEVILHMLEQHDIYVSTGSACSSHKKGGSHVLTAMGLSPDETEGAIRFSLSPYNTEEEIDYTLEWLKKSVEDNRRMLAIASKGFRR